MFEDRLFVASLLALLGVAAAGIAFLIRTIGLRVRIVRPIGELANLATKPQPTAPTSIVPGETVIARGSWEVVTPPCRCGKCSLFRTPSGQEASIRYAALAHPEWRHEAEEVAHIALRIMLHETTPEVEGVTDDGDAATDETPPC